MNMDQMEEMQSIRNADIPPSLTEEFYRAANDFEDVDTQMWLYLLELIPDDGQSYCERKRAMLNSVSRELKRYFLTRQFDWERGSGGLEACLMMQYEVGEDELFIEETIAGFEELGALEYATIIKELIPIARKLNEQIEAAGSRGEEFDFDDSRWEPYENRWNSASNGFNFYSVVWDGIQKDPSKYVHPR